MPLPTRMATARGTSNEPLGTATKQWTVMPPSSLTLDPPSASNQINTEHCVTATVRDATNRLQGNRTVRFSVSGVNAPPDAAATSDFAGEAKFCYTGALPGDDTISAFVDTNNNGLRETDGTEPTASATKTWTGVVPPNVTINDVSVTEGDAGTTNCDLHGHARQRRHRHGHGQLRHRRRHRHRRPPTTPPPAAR